MGSQDSDKRRGTHSDAMYTYYTIPPFHWLPPPLKSSPSCLWNLPENSPKCPQGFPVVPEDKNNHIFLTSRHVQILMYRRKLEPGGPDASRDERRRKREWKLFLSLFSFHVTPAKTFSFSLPSFACTYGRHLPLSKRTYVRTILFFLFKVRTPLQYPHERNLPLIIWICVRNSTPDVDCRYVVGDLRWLDENPTGVEGDLPFFGYRGMCQSHPFFSSLGTNPHHHHQASQIWNQGEKEKEMTGEEKKKPCLFYSDFSWLVGFVFFTKDFSFFPFRDSRTMML